VTTTVIKINTKRPDDYDVYIGRRNRWIPKSKPGSDGKWGNSFTIGKNGTRDEVIQKYRDWIMIQPKLLKQIPIELKDRRLGCWCKPLPCHGDVLAELANLLKK
jgi:hypothetical protein